MGVGIHTVYIVRLDDEDEPLYLCGDFKPHKNSEGEWCSAPGAFIGYDMGIPNLWPWVRHSEDAPREVRAVEYYKETGLYMVALDDYFGNEIHVFNTKPTLTTDKYGHRRYKEGQKYRDCSPWRIHFGHGSIDTDLESYQEVRNVMFIPIDWNTEFTFSVSKKDLPDGIGEPDCRNIVIRKFSEDFQRYLITAYAKSEEDILKQWPQAYQIEARNITEH